MRFVQVRLVRPHGFMVVFMALLLSLFSALSQEAHAQTREYGPMVLELPSSASALALGNSFQLGCQDPSAIFYHPGALNRAQGMIASAQRYQPSSTQVALAAGTRWGSGVVALGVQFLTYGASASDPIDGSDILALPADAGSLRDEGNVAASETVVSVGYGRRLFGLQMGVVGKFIEQRFGPRQAAVGAVDLGATFSPGPLSVGLAAQNLGPDLTIGGEEIPLPLRFTLGASSRQAPVGPLDLSASAAVTYRIEGEAVPSAGLQAGYWPVTGRTFIARLGYRYLPDEQSGCPVTFGGAFLGDAITLEYAYEGFDSGKAAHRFGIGWR